MCRLKNFFCPSDLKIRVRRRNAGLKVEGVVDSKANWIIAKAHISSVRGLAAQHSWHSSALERRSPSDLPRLQDHQNDQNLGGLVNIQLRTKNSI